VLFFLKKIGSAMHTVTQNSVSEGEVLVKAMKGKNGSGTFQLASFFERTSEMVFRHVLSQNTPACGDNLSATMRKVCHSVDC
jgi:hypothetical protein